MATATYVDREQASELLKVSTRTVDRYIRKYRLKTKKKGRTLLIRKQDVDKVIQDQVGHLVDLNVPQFSNPLKKEQNNESSLAIKNIKIDQVKPAKPSNEAEKVYRELYNETKKDLQAKQERLEAATYRVGQLEAQLKNMVPMLDYSQKEKQLKQSQQALEQKVVENKVALGKVEKKLKNERLAKSIYLFAAVLFLLLWPAVSILIELTG